MSNVRPFNRDDIAEVADLFVQVFLSDLETDIDDLRSHFEAVYFDHPFRDDDCPSLVYCDAKGAIVAFLGVMPRRMRFSGETIKVAIAGNLMVRGAKGGTDAAAGGAASHGYQLAPAALVKAFFRCPHDLALTDSAIEPSRRIWERSGGEAIRLYSLRWLCMLKPFGFGLDTLGRRSRFRSLFRWSKPVGMLADHVVRPLIAPAKPSMSTDCTIDRVQPEEIVEELQQCKHYDLVPDYSVESLAWVLEMASSRKCYGALRALIMRDKSGGRLGWAIYTSVPGEVGHVLQLYAHPKTMARVLACLLFDAAESGVVALSGKADPLFIDHLGKSNCVLRINAWTLAQTRRPELLRPFLIGKAMFTELESEGWTRFLGASPKREFSPV
ncbi:MAG: hypothetical protein OEU92_25820 [Alphaproteobacteria bacterium]|nr:hypothetical protein [Alphaproteobacteria bacterium]